MNKIFQDLMDEATRLTRDGNLHAAMAAIRQALGGGPPGSYDGARSGSPGEAAAPPGGSSQSSGNAARTSGNGSRSSGNAPPGQTSADPADVIDLELREIHSPDDTHADPLADPHIDAEVRPGRTPVQAPAPRTAPADRPGGSHPSTGRLRATFQWGSLSREYELYVPPVPGKSENRSRPLIVMLHGCTQSSPDFARGTEMDDLAAEFGFLVLYPEQSARHNPQRCWNWFKKNHQRRDAGEPGLLAALTRAVMVEYAVDPARVYVAGLSAGGAMAAILASTYPDLFAAIGVHSGLATGMAGDLPAALATMRQGPGQRRGSPLPPTIVFHGDADQTVHPDHADALFDACCSDRPWTTSTSTRDARTHDQASPGWSGVRASVTTCADASGHVKAERWIVHGAGHAWSGGSSKGSFTQRGGPSASREMVRFFLTHARTAR